MARGQESQVRRGSSASVALANPQVRRLMLSETLSGLGDGVFWVGLIAELVSNHGESGWFAAAAVARLGPRAVISAPAGVLADRADRRRLLVSIDLSRAVLMVALAGFAAGSGAPVAMLAIVLITYTLASPYRPALTAALPLVAGEEDASIVNAVFGTVRQLMTFIGPVVGAGVLQVTTPTVAFLINGATFVMSALLLASVPSLSGGTGTTVLDDPVLRRSSWRSDFVEGVREVRTTAGLMLITGLVLVMYLVRGSELVFHVLVARDRLGLGSNGVGLLSGAIGLGAVLALPVAGFVARLDRPALAMVLSLATTAVPMALLAVVRRPLVACGLLVVLGIGVVVFEVLSIMLIQRLSGIEKLGRVFGIVSTASNAGRLVGALIAVALVAAVGLSASLVLTGVVVVVVALGAFSPLTTLGRAAASRRRELAPLVAVLSRAGVFELACLATLERIAAVATIEKIPAGTVVIREGDPADDLYVACSGTFDVTVGGRVINTMGPGDWFGEIGLIQHLPRTASVVTTSPTEVVRVPGEEFLHAVSESAAPPTAMLEAMAGRLDRSHRAELGGWVGP